MSTAEMPDRVAENLIKGIRLNEGKLGRKRSEGEFEKLHTDFVISSCGAELRAIVSDAGVVEIRVFSKQFRSGCDE